MMVGEVQLQFHFALGAAPNFLNLSVTAGLVSLRRLVSMSRCLIRIFQKSIKVMLGIASNELNVLDKLQRIAIRIAAEQGAAA